MSKALEVKDLFYQYPDGTPALNGVSLSLKRGEKLAVIGANGSGKSTLLAHLAGCFVIESGEILLFDEPVGREPERLRNAVGMIFQDPDDQLFMPSVLEDVAFGLISRGMDVPKARELAMKALEEILIPHLAHRPPHRLSGGEKRMVALAGILVMRPDILVLDEPSATLDPRARRRVIDVLRPLDQSMVIATHDLDLALDVCTGAVIMSGGKITVCGKLPDLLKDKTLLLENGLELPLKFLS